MNKQVYLTGYTSKKPADLKAMVERMGARLIDIRYSANSRVPQWRNLSLVDLLGDAYYHLIVFGNIAYKEKRIQVYNFPAGESWLFWHFKDHPEQPVILMCACKDAKVCHRTNVGERLAALGYNVEELSEWK
jgi:hypothetical protein